MSVALAPFRMAEGGSQRITFAGENIRLSPKAALALGIAFNELATNALKYGALSKDTGTIAIVWKVAENSGGRRLSVCWREHGGPAVLPPTRRGFGSRVIEQGLAHELDRKVELDYRPDGIICTMSIPAPRSLLDK